MITINFKVIALTRPGLVPAGSGFKPARFSEHTAGESGAVLIQPPCLVEWWKGEKEEGGGVTGEGAPVDSSGSPHRHAPVVHWGSRGVLRGNERRRNEEDGAARGTSRVAIGVDVCVWVTENQYTNSG